MWFITFVYKNIAHRPLRSFLTIVAIAMAIGSFVTLVGISSGFEATFLQLYETSGIDIIVVRKGGQQGLNSLLDERLTARLRELPGVKAVIGGLADYMSFGDRQQYQAVFNGWEPGSAAFDHLRIVAGRSLTKEDRKCVLIGTILAENITKNVGDHLELMEGENFEIVGRYDTSNVLENGALIVPLKEMQRFTDKMGMVTGFSLIMQPAHKDSTSIADTCTRIEQLASTLRARSSDEFVRSRTEIQLAKGMAWLTSLIALLIGTFGMMNTMVMSIHERTREIGTLRAVGWRKGRVIRMIMAEALLLSVAGALVGTLGSFALLRILTRVPLANGLIDGRLDPRLILEGFLIAIAVGLLGGILPARRATRLLPIVGFGMSNYAVSFTAP